MFTPGVTRHRKNLRLAINNAFPGVKADEIFDSVKKQGSSFVELYDLEPYCEKVNCPAAVVNSIFTPYGSKNVVITKEQWVAFMNDDFPILTETPAPGVARLDQKQRFLLSKFVAGVEMKFGSSPDQRWRKALARNPPNTVNTALKLSALCHIFECMMLPFTVPDFIDAIFAFFGEKIDSITFDQFGTLFSSFE